MKRKLFLTTTAAIAALTLVSGSALAQEVPTGGVEVTASETSATGYTASFTYADEEATNVRLNGSFTFYKKDDVHFFSGGFAINRMDGYNSGIQPSDSDWLAPCGNSYVYPQDWQKGAELRHIGDAFYRTDMTYDETTKTWSVSLDLPCASYLYQYEVSYDNGETWEAITDPANTPYVNSLGAHQARSQFFVPFDAEKQDPEDDWTWLFPAENEEEKGTVSYMTYESTIASDSPLMVYTPAGYDPNREEPYKVLYLSHGGGGEVADWFHQANLANILDHFMADGTCEEFLAVTMDNSAFVWDYDKIYDNFINHIIPFVEENYNASTESEGRALVGLSMGARVANQMLYHDPTLFGYLGIWSASEPYACPKLDDYSDYNYPNIFLAAGFADPWLAYGFPGHPETYFNAVEDNTMISIASKFDEIGVTYNNGNGIYVVDGSHDWFNWPQVLREYLTTVLWK